VTEVIYPLSVRVTNYVALLGTVISVFSHDCMNVVIE